MEISKNKVSREPVSKMNAPDKTGVISNDKTKLPTIPAKLPEDGSIITSLRNISACYPTWKLFYESRAGFKRLLREYVKEVMHLKENKADYSLERESVTKLLNGFNKANSPGDLDKLLMNIFNSSNKKEKELVLRWILFANQGFSPKIGEILEGNSNKRGFCIESLKKLSEDDLRQFIYGATPLDKNNVDNLAEALLKISNNEELAYEALKSSADDMISNSKFNKSDEINNKQLLLLALMKNMKSKLDLDDVLVELDDAMSVEVMSKTCEVISTRYKNPGQVFLTFLIDDDYLDIENFIVNGLLMFNYIKELKQESIPKVKELITNSPHSENSYVASMACDALVSYCGEEGLKTIEDIITNDFKSNKPSLTLAVLAYGSYLNPAYDKALEKIFSNKEINLKEAFIQIHNSDLSIGTRPDNWLHHKHGRPRLPMLIRKIGMNDRFANWIACGETPELRKNAKDVLDSAIRLDIKDLLKKDIGTFLRRNDTQAKAFRKWINNVTFEPKSNS